MTADFHRTGIASQLPEAFDTVSGYTPPMRARAAMLVGDTARALHWIERSVEGEWPDLFVVWVAPLYDPLRNHPRFQALMEDYLGDREPPLSLEPSRSREP